MHFGLQPLPSERAHAGRPSERELHEQAAHGGGLDGVRDAVSKDDKRRRALRAVGGQLAQRRIQAELGMGRVAATKGSKGG